LWLFFNRSSAHFHGSKPFVPDGNPYPGMYGLPAFGAVVTLRFAFMPKN
jgi:hypothetical protein